MSEDKGERKKLFSRLFPQEYDFHHMLQDQAEETREGVSKLIDWLEHGGDEEPKELLAVELKADDMRHDMESKLMKAFSTPFDRQDIYEISRQMDHILNYSLSTAQEMRAFDVHSDDAIMKMARSLYDGTVKVEEAIKLMQKDSAKAEGMISNIRVYENEIEATYISAMSAVLLVDEAIDAVKKREVYHHLKDAGRTLSITIDILHRIIVGIA